MRLLRPLRPLQLLRSPSIPTQKHTGRLTHSSRPKPEGKQLVRYGSKWKQKTEPRTDRRSPLMQALDVGKEEEPVNHDHRTLSTQFELFTTHESSPGSPLFHPNGALIFQRLQSFLRAQYPAFGFREVVTPTIYKDSLWKQSGHWDNYQDDMFSVSSRRKRPPAAVREGVDVTLGTTQPTQGPAFTISKALGGEPTPSAPEPSACNHNDDVDSGDYGLKPMNCPGHCLLFKSRKLSYRELPVRYADFSPLHRNEISGSLSGLTRVRRFHQDDGHIFCRPSQVGQEIGKQLDFVDMVYNVFGMRVHKLVLSTRPLDGNFIGKAEDWDRAEEQLRTVLQNSGHEWELNKGDGAFYGPKIDVILLGNDARQHQTATIQLDFQLPQRFGLEYEAPAPEQERLGLESQDPAQLEQKGMVTPVMIHRAILGSFERFMALLIEHYNGRWPFWLSPRQVIILAVGDNPTVLNHVSTLQDDLRMPHETGRLPRRMDAPRFQVDIDLRSESLAKKVASAKRRKYSIICVYGEKDLKGNSMVVDLSGIPNQLAIWNIMEKIKPGSQAPVKKNVPTEMNRNIPGARLEQPQLIRLMETLTGRYL